MKFDVYVVPRASSAGAAGRHDGVPRLRVSSPPADGRANTEAEKLLTKILGTRVVLVAGAASRRKTFDVDLASAQLKVRLDDAFGS